MGPRRILVLGGGFAGLWSALAAARQLDQLGLAPDAVEVLLVNRDAFHGIRVRNYEPDLTPLRVPLEAVLAPAGVRWLVGEVGSIDLAARTVTVLSESWPQNLAYDRLVFALGSQLLRPEVPGLVEHGFDVDTYAGASKLAMHLQALVQHPEAPGQFTAVVVGAGLTGIEAACELPARLRSVQERAGLAQPLRVVLVDHNPKVGSDMGDAARPVIEEALAALGVELRLGVRVDGLDGASIRFDSGEILATSTVLWCAGMRASPLTAGCGVATDALGRLPVDAVLRVEGLRDVFAAGDSANLALGDGHTSVMSCQHGRPMGRFAGHNAVCDLLGLPLLPLRIDWYTTILDLGPWGALYTEGWDRQVVATGETAKRTKRLINGVRIVPPLNGDRAEILAAAAPVIQRPPPLQPLGSQR
ncbi:MULTISPECIES: NAD(P)/FAD-dependent oxidoreductase [unclassified Cyanobium]|uniref:NAD(P)/FAD-dependent oxidoreductase n=1 Tax=unclassified Cyanobium TaxID=2627006 RepID=UPI0020CC778E|nr:MULTISPECIES: FAD-dependent oxidoreductase [unclassified Cyanobium]MCP9834576.1 FAD-dependent oxidoreductase [Cyanobium sp. La Preciosa 7G6]MCP9937339.1 FAD-dependent oxidoreductase [Cyanobium sp. Aljojuca 7A6]